MRFIRLNPFLIINLRKKKRKFSFVNTGRSISVAGTRLSDVTAEYEFRYIGVQFTWKGVAQTPLDLEKFLCHNRDALKPQQKLIIHKRFLRVRLQQQLTFGWLHKGELIKCDKAVRRSVLRWLLLPVLCG